jgi:hypothetical protein
MQGTWLVWKSATLDYSFFGLRKLGLKPLTPQTKETIGKRGKTLSDAKSPAFQTKKNTCNEKGLVL